MCAFLSRLLSILPNKKPPWHLKTEMPVGILIRQCNLNSFPRYLFVIRKQSKN